MATTANLPDAVNRIGVEPGELSPEDAERFAEAFRPIWEFDEAPFAATPAALTADDMRELGAGGVNADVAAALHAPAPAVAQPTPAPVRRSAPPKSRRPVAAADPFAAPPPAVQRPSGRDASSSLEIPALRKSNKGLFIAGGAVVAAIALFVAVRALSSDDASTAPAKANTAATSREESRIPAPEAVVPQAPPPSTAAPADPTPAPAPAKAERPERPEPPAAPPPQVTHAAPAPRPAPPPRAAPAAPRPAAPAAPKPKSGGGSIVRDNPF